ncbi:MAG: class I SAM-dependent rRNA methyltransferase [Gemmatimonadetes bacterium]|nr:class I SAM-dependent rRNA methyltransferase [Gemmatimonadota bacterium]
MIRPAVHLDAKGVGPARGRHPWIFSGAITRVVGDPEPGAEVDVHDPHGVHLGRGLFNPKSQIRVRLYTSMDEPLDGAFFAARVRRAIALRSHVLGLDDLAGACRLVFSEGDELSGLTVDRYARHLVVILTSLGIAGRLEPILDALEEALRPESITLRTEKGVGEEEGLVVKDGPLRGTPPTEHVIIQEDGLRFAIDLRTGQKTGFYLDQRMNRARVAAYSAGRSVADVCSYTGGFAMAVAKAGATSVTAVDASASALELAARNAELNGIADRLEIKRADAFGWLEEVAAAGRTFDMIVLDPPRFARSRAGLKSALQGYQRLNRLALDCLAPGGVLATFSCSGRVSAEAFQEAVARAAASCGRPLRILERLAQAPDHPVSTACPQGSYLKGFILAAE